MTPIEQLPNERPAFEEPCAEAASTYMPPQLVKTQKLAEVTGFLPMSAT